MKIRIKDLLAIGFMISVFMLIAACSGGGGSDSSGSEESATDLTGTWNLREITNGNCEGRSYPSEETDVVTVDQTGNELSLTFSSTGTTVDGTISGNEVTWSETIPDEGGTILINFSGTVSDDCNTITGGATWTWTDGGYTCSGTTEVTARRIIESSVDVTGTWNGTWKSSVRVLSGTFTAKIEQHSSTLSGSIDVPEIGMRDANLKGTVDGNTITFGDIEEQITFTGTVNGNSSSGTYVYPSLGDNGTWQGNKEVSGNNAPIAYGQLVSTTDDTPLDINLTANDPDGDELTWHIDTQPAHGTLSGTAPALTYTSAAGWAGCDSFTFHVSDGTVDSNMGTVSITMVKKIWYKQFEETSYYLKDVCFVSSEVGWAVGVPHWDQTKKGYESTIIKTVDGGESWIAQEASVGETLRGVCFVDANNGWVVGTNGTILHTNDGGDNWRRQTVDKNDEFRGVVFVDANHGWATSIRPVHYDWLGDPDDWRGSIWYTSDGGETWRQQTIPGDSSILNRIKFIDSENGWVVGTKFIENDPWPQHVGVVYHTSDGGLTWQEQYCPELDIVFTGVDFIDVNHGWVVGFKGNSGVEGGTVFHTTDGGLTWERQEPSNTFWDVQFLDPNRGYAVGCMYGAAWGPPVLRTVDGGITWETVAMHRHDGEGLYGVSVVGDRVVTVGDHDYVAISTDSWETYERPDGKNLFTQKYINIHYRFEDVFFADESRGWAVGKRSYEPDLWGQIIFYTNDGGATWETQYELAPPDQLFSYFRLDSVYFTDRQNGWAVGSSEFFGYGDGQAHLGAILYTTDGGLHWEEQVSEICESWDREFFAVQFLDSQNGWALDHGHFDPSANGQSLFLAHTTDGGITWEWVPTGIQGSMSVGFAMVQGDMIFTDEHHGWAVGGLGKVIHTDDGGINWVKQELPSQWRRLFAVEFLDDQVGWIAGEGLYHTTDGGSTWIEQDTGISSSLYGSTDFQDIQFTDSLNGWLAGCSGLIMHTKDGGITWNLTDSGTSSHLRGISFISPDKGWVVGDEGTIIAITNQ